jgi:transcription termination factor NusB
MTTLFVPKQFHTYTDILLTLGLVKVIADALSQTYQKQAIQLIQVGTGYQIQFSQPINLEAIANLDYVNPCLPVKGAKTKWDNIPPETPYFDVVEEVEIRKLHREYVYQTGGKKQPTEESPSPPDARTQNGAILISMRHEGNHNNLWLDSWNFRDIYGQFINDLIEIFSINAKLNYTEVLERLSKKSTKINLQAQANAVKIYLPTLVQGVNRTKADTNQYGSQKANWLDLWLIAIGFFEFALSERIKIAEGSYDWRVVVLEPQNISFLEYKQTLDSFRKYNPPSGGHGVARFDSELILKLSIELLNRHEAKAKDEPIDPFDYFNKSVNQFVGNFQGTQFNSKGQVYGVKEVFSLGLPNWICPKNYEEVSNYKEVLDEHLKIIRSLNVEEGYSDLLYAYRTFITGTNIRQFFPFQQRYANYIVRKLADNNSPNPYLFSTQGLNLMTQQEKSLTKITQDPSFLRIAKAINQATVYAGEIQTKSGKIKLDWERNYGLAQLLSTQSGSKKDFVCAITDFLAKYEHENLRISEKLAKEGKVLKRIWTKKEDLDRLIELIEENDHVLVANLLIAYGYAKWNTKTEPTTETTQEEE